MSISTLGNAKFVLVCVAILFPLVAIQPCDAVPWSGSNDYFLWSNGSSTNDSFGTPQLDTENTLIFSPLGFEAISLDGITDSIVSTLEFELLAKPGYGFQTILITQSGNYEIDDAGTVDVSGSLSIENLDTSEILSQPLSFALDSPNPNTWQSSAQKSVPASWTHIRITFLNTLSATADDGSVASITNTESGIKISVQVPEPATIGILAIGALSLVRRRK